MRNIFLIRHCEPEFPAGIKCCLGKLDLLLSEKGKSVAKKLADFFAGEEISAAIASPLARSRQTAEIIADKRWPIILAPELEEINTGLWDGMTFNEIRETYPEDYQKRGENLARVPFPGGESYHQVLRRSEPLVERMINKYDGNLLIVGHACVNQGLLSKWLGLDLEQAPALKQSYGGISLIEERSGIKKVKYINRKIEAIPNEKQCEALLKKYQTGKNICAHGRSVKDLALDWSNRLALKNCRLNHDLILAAALLHDIARTEKNHAATGARWIRQEGYPLVAEVIEAHHLLAREDEENISEKTIVYLADKKITGCRQVSIDERFEISKNKCNTLVGKVKHQLAYQQAKKVESLIEKTI
ncbi:histidine phosphatase family protein [Eubacteriaceae bacterium ES2]|nr:histidine phosphatase family protein [Eubacteriaceae bacterium ES2]